MTASLHPATAHHLPPFVTAPGETDVLMAVMAVFLVGAVLAVGLLFLRLHTLPERIAHKSTSCSSRSSLCWACWPSSRTCTSSGGRPAARLIDFPESDGRSAGSPESLEAIAGNGPREGTTKGPDVGVAEITRREGIEEPDSTGAPARRPKERIHA